MELIVTLLPAFGVLALLFVLFKNIWVSKQEVGDPNMARIAKNIADGAMSFLKAEYKILSIFVVAVAVLLYFKGENEAGSNGMVALSFIVGAICSALAGFIGMRVATKANVRTTQAARTSLGKALEVAFAGGSVMGLGVVGLGVLGLSGLFMIYQNIWPEAENLSMVLNVLSGFSLGASSIALFARVGGGIYTKAADVGADLVGKVEAGIPEDHPLNPATIADNVGDNVGDVAGMGADLFESYVGSIIGTMVLGAYIFTPDFGGLGAVYLPLVLAALGIVMSILGTFFVKVKEGGNPQTALNIGEFGSAFLMIIASYFVINAMIPDTVTGLPFGAMGVFWATIAGLLAGLGVGKITEYYTGTGTKPVNGIVRQSETGAATNIIAGLGVGMMSTAVPIILIAGALGGMIWGGVPGVLRARTGAHEVISTIMLNSIALFITRWLVNSRDPVILRDTTASVPRTKQLPESAILPEIADSQPPLHLGLFVMIAVCIAVAFVLRRTVLGFEVITVGTNPHAAHYAGIGVNRIIILAMALSGAFAGVAAAGEISGTTQTFQPGTFAFIGFDGIAIALLARANPIAIIPASLLWGSLLAGAPLMQQEADVSIDVVRIIQAMVLLFVAADAIVRYLFRLRGDGGRHIEAAVTGWSG